MSRNYEFGPRYYDPTSGTFRVPSLNNLFKMYPPNSYNPLTGDDSEHFDNSNTCSLSTFLILLIILSIIITVFIINK